jgi:hypothetical protein
MDTKLPHQVEFVGVDGLAAHAQINRRRPHRFSLGQQLYNFQFPGRKALLPDKRLFFSAQQNIAPFVAFRGCGQKASAVCNRRRPSPTASICLQPMRPIVAIGAHGAAQLTRKFAL